MKHPGILVPTLVLAVSAGFSPRIAKQDASSRASRTRDVYGKLPLRFEANAGQTDPRVRFLARGVGYSVFLTPSEAVLVLGPRTASARGVDPRARTLEPPTAAEQTVLYLRLLGARPDPEVAGVGELAGRSHYLLGRAPAQWRTNIPNYGSVRYSGVYPGVDMVYHGKPGELEYDFVVAPGGDPNVIRLAIEGGDHVELDPEGDMVVRTAGGVLRQRRPLTYQEVGDERREVASRFVEKGDGFGFEVGEFDRSRPLVIDPAIVYSTYLGGSGYDGAHSVVVDDGGYAYVAGLAGSTNFPPPNPIQPGGLSHADAFVLKMDPTGSGLVYSTYLGGSGWDEAFDIAVDARGAAYIAGYTNSLDLPIAGPTPSAYGGGAFDGFVSKIDAAGTTLLFSRYLGGKGYDAAQAVAVDAHESPYVTGWTLSVDFPTTVGSLQPASGGIHDAFVAKLDAATFDLAYSTYLGGSNFDNGTGIAVDADGFAYVTGATDSANFPVVLPALQPAFAWNGTDAFVAKLDPTGGTLAYSTYLGGYGGDGAMAIVVDGGRRAYVTGYASSTNFPVKLPPPATSVHGGATYDAFVARLDAAGTSLLYSRYLGGADVDVGYGIALWDNSAYVTGMTSSGNFPLTNPVQGALAGRSDAFVTRLDPSGANLPFSTYLGGSGLDWGEAIAVAPRGGAVHIAGSTYSANFPTAPNPPFQASMGGGTADGFVTKIVPAAADVSVVKTAPSSVQACTQLDYSIVVTNNGPDAATRVTLVDTLPPGLASVSASTSAGFCTVSPGNVTCDLSPLPNGASATVALRVVPRGGNLFNAATANGREVDVNPGNNTGIAVTFVWVPPFCWPWGCPSC